MVRSAIDPIRPGASLILAWQIKHKHVLIIGGGFVAAGRKSLTFHHKDPKKWKTK